MIIFNKSIHNICIITVLFIGVVMLASGCEVQPQLQAQPLSNAQLDEFKTLENQLTDTQRNNETRLDAATLLLTKPYPQANELLARLLSDSSRPVTQIAIAQAIAEDSSCPEKFVKPLFAMLKTPQADIQLAAAQALATTKNQGTLKKLLDILSDPDAGRTQKLAIISALERNYDRQSIKALIDLLSSKDRILRNAAAVSLRKITGIASFGSDKNRWAIWWQQHKIQSRQQWLEELAANLTKSRLALQRHNAILSERLTKTLEELYNTAPAAQKSEMILAMLNDPLAEVRLLGLTQAVKMLDSGKALSPEVTSRISAMMFDVSPLVRKQAASLQSETNPKNATRILIGRLNSETYPAVRVALLEELGQIKSPETIAQVTSSISSPDDSEAAAAARSLAQLAEKNHFTEAQKLQAEKALRDRYNKAQAGHNALELREAILSAMGVLAVPDAHDIFQAALKSDSGAIRLAAVNGLARLQNPKDAATLLPYTKDEDRGVRHAAVKAIGQLGDQTYLDDLISLASPKLESDPTVRQEAMEAAVALCQKADPKTLVKSLALMKQQQQIDSQLKIELLSQYASYLQSQNSPRQLTVDIELAEEYAQVGNVSQAQLLLEKSLASAQKLGDKSPVDPISIWNRLVRLMIDSSSTSVIKTIAEQKNAKARSAAIAYLVKWFKSPAAQNNLLAAIAMADGALTQLDKNLSKDQAAGLHKFTVAALAKQQQADTETTNRLLDEYIKGDAKVKAQVLQQLKAMGDRSHKPLLLALKTELGQKTPSAVKEAALVTILKQIVTEMGDYTQAEPLPQKIAKIDKLLQNIK